MSHYVAVVLVEADCPDVAARVAELLAPYDENREMPPYRVPYSAEEVAEIRGAYELPDDAPLADLVPHIEDWSGYPGGVDGDTLYKLSTYNTLSKWDWFVIGGRWDGWITGDDRVGDKNNPAPRWATAGGDLIERNSCLARDFAAPYLPHDIITPHGGWHAKAWWDRRLSKWGNDPEWDTRARRLLADEYPDCLAVTVDYHM